jgi:hypothetical protein
MKTANIRLFTGLLALPAILLQDNPFGVMLQAVYVIVLALIHGRKFRLLPNLILMLSVSSAHLLQPNGYLIVSIGSFPITLGALLLGLRKAFTLIALLYLSHYMVTGRPEFPGRLGKVISLQFYYFDKITSGWREITPKRPFIKAVDTLMLNLTEEKAASIMSIGKDEVVFNRRELLENILHTVVLWGLFLLGAWHILPTL